MSVKRKKKTSPATKPVRAGATGARGKAPSSKAPSAKARPAKTSARKPMARKATAAKPPAARATKSATPGAAKPKKPAATGAKVGTAGAKPKAAGTAARKATVGTIAAKPAKKPAKAVQPAKKPAKAAKPAARKTARGKAGAAPSHGAVTYAPTPAGADSVFPHTDAEAVSTGERRRGAGLDAAAPARSSGPRPDAKPTLAEASKSTGDNQESPESSARVGKLVPTNAVHTTKRRMRRSFWQKPMFGVAAAGIVLALLILGHEGKPPDVSPPEYRADARSSARSRPGQARPPISDPVQAAPDRTWRAPVGVARPVVPEGTGRPTQQAERPPAGSWGGMNVLELVEIERILARLDLGPSRPDGVVEEKTESAIRMYQQIAGLPVDGAPSPELLDDMREVVKILEGPN